MSFAIETIGLTKYFSKVCALENVNLGIAKGELFGLVGPNGAGKTTLLRILSTLILPTSGECYINGYSLSEEKEIQKVKSSINLVSDEERSFYWRLTGRQNLQFFAQLYGISSTGTIKKRIEEIAELLEIEAQLDLMFKDYSSGIKQKMAIARSLINKPQVIFMDEPTRNLDLKIKRKLYGFIKEKLIAEEGRTILLVSHQLDEVAQVCNRIAIIDRGKIVAQGTLEELRQTCQTLEVARIKTDDSSNGSSLEEIFVAVT